MKKTRLRVVAVFSLLVEFKGGFVVLQGVLAKALGQSCFVKFRIC
jgi:hypothetical protein